jgi:hypothetical protein
MLHGRSPAKPVSLGTLDNRRERAWAALEAAPAALTMHEARHTYASLMIAAGVQARALSEFMGHSSIATTLDRYGHLSPGAHAEAAAMLDATGRRRADVSADRGCGQRQQSLQERRVATRSLLPSGSSKSHSRPARPSSSTGTPNSWDTASMSPTYKWMSVLGRASPLCSER